MRYLYSKNHDEYALYVHYKNIVKALKDKGVHISNAYDLVRYLQEHNCVSDFEFVGGFAKFCEDVNRGCYDGNVKISDSMVRGRDVLRSSYGVNSYRELVEKFETEGLPEGFSEDMFVEGSFLGFKQAVEAGYYDYDEELWVYPSMTITESLQARFGVRTYRELVARIDREGLEAVYGTHTVDFVEGSYEAFRQSVLEGKYDNV